MLARDARLGYTARRDGVLCTDAIPLSIVANTDHYDDGDLSCEGAFWLPLCCCLFHVFVEERTTDVVNF